jgi:hypothetical protein
MVGVMIHLSGIIPVNHSIWHPALVKAKMMFLLLLIYSRGKAVIGEIGSFLAFSKRTGIFIWEMYLSHPMSSYISLTLE